MRRRKAGQIVLAERQRFSQLQRAGQRSETFTGEMGKGSARRLMKYQRLQPGVTQPAQEIFIPGLIALRQNAEANVVGRADCRVQIQMPARRPRDGKKRGHDVLQPLSPRRFIALRKLRPAAAKHAVNVAHQIPFVLRQRRRIAEHHQHAAL